VNPDTYAVFDHLAALRRSVADGIWLPSVDAPVVALFNELLAEARAVRPDAQVLRVIEPQKSNVRPQTLLALADQILLALDN
jgi:hypothetical protein